MHNHFADYVPTSTGLEAGAFKIVQQIGKVAAVVNHAGPHPEHTGKEGGAAGQAGRVCYVKVGRANPFLRHRINVGRGLPQVTITG